MPADLDFIKMAASRVGYDPNQLDATDDPARVLVELNFDVMVGAELERYPWKWNEYEEHFTPAAPTVGEQGQYQGVITLTVLPMRIVSVHQNNTLVRYERRQGQLFLYSYDTTRKVTVRAQWPCEIGQWPDLFREVMLARFAGQIGSSIMQRPGLLTEWNNYANVLMMEAKFADSSQQPMQRIRTGRIAARRNNVSTSPIPLEGDVYGP